MIVFIVSTGIVMFGFAGSSESASPSYVARPMGTKSWFSWTRCAAPQHVGSNEITRQPRATIALSKSHAPLMPNEYVTHLRRLGSSVSQKAGGARSGELEGITVPLPAGQPLFAGTSSRMTALMHFLHSIPSKPSGFGSGAFASCLARHFPLPPRPFPPDTAAQSASTTSTVRRAIWVQRGGCHHSAAFSLLWGV